MTKHEHEKKVTEDFRRYYCLSSIMEVEPQNEIEQFLCFALHSHAAIVEAETVERCIEKIKSYRIYDWSSEQAIYEQLEEIITAIRSLQGKNDKV